MYKWLFLNLISVLLLSACSVLHPGGFSYKAKGFADTKRSAYVAKVVNKITGASYYRTSAISKHQARLRALRDCHAHTPNINVCRFVTATEN